MGRLTKSERMWLEDVQEVLNRCPSKRLGFYTIGDPSVTVYDRKHDVKIAEMQNRRGIDFCTGVREVKAGLGSLDFPSSVHSTSG